MNITQHHFSHVSLVEEVRNPASFKDWDIDSISSWEESQRICGHVFKPPHCPGRGRNIGVGNEAKIK